MIARRGWGNAPPALNAGIYRFAYVPSLNGYGLPGGSVTLPYREARYIVNSISVSLVITPAGT